jgi:hypothetical protein
MRPVLKSTVSRAAAEVRQLKKTLRQRTVALALSERARKERMAERNALSRALRKTSEDNTKLQSASRDQQQRRRVTRRMLSSQENDRSSLSRNLRGHVAQAMLAIQVRLAYLKKEAARNTLCLKREIASAQRLVDRAVRTLERFHSRVKPGHES